MNVEKLLKNWSLPDVTSERQQITLRLHYDLYAKLHALKDVYNQRPVNDIINDILRASLDEIIDALPVYKISHQEAEEIAHYEGGRPEDYYDTNTGPKIFFENSYQGILRLKESGILPKNSQQEITGEVIEEQASEDDTK
jgi:hypothetical protein